MENIQKNQLGMSLLEVMVAFSILSLTFIALTQSFPASLAINKSSENATKAAYLAQAKLEELNSLGYDGISTGMIETKHRLAASSSDYLYYFQRQTLVSYVDANLADSGTDTGLKKIAVTVYYMNALAKTETEYSTVTLTSRW